MVPNRQVPEHWSHPAFLDAVKEQLTKDFDWDAERLAEVSLSLFELLESHISASLERDAPGVFNSFYKLDLGEDLVREILHNYDAEEASRQFAERSLQRAALKVWTRWTYS